MHHHPPTDPRAEHGVALLISVIVLILLSAIGLAALQHAKDESVGGGRSRHHTKTLHAADGVLQVVIQQLASENVTQRELPVDLPNFLQDPVSGFWTSGRTGTPDAGVAQNVLNCGSATKDGDAIGEFPRLIYCVNVTANTGGGRIGLDAQYSVLDAAGGNQYR